MQAAGPIKKGRDQETGQKHSELHLGKGILHDTVQGDGPVKAYKCIEDGIDVIMTKAKEVENGHDLDQKIGFYIIPPRIVGGEEVGKASLVRGMEKVGKKLKRVCFQQIVFAKAFHMIGPGVEHLCHLAIIHADPSIKYACHYLEQEKNDQL